MEESVGPAASTRREFLKQTGLLAGASVVVLAGGGPFGDAEALAATSSIAASNDTIRMVQDLERALTRPIETRRWGMLIDARRCIGCHACRVACIAQNGLPVGVSYRTVPEIESGTYPSVQRFFMPANCMQCEKAPCIRAANAVAPGSMGRRPDGIVTINYAKMKGPRVFRAAVKACPYDAALYYDTGRLWTAGTPSVEPYDTNRSHEYGKTWSRAKTKGTTRKCHFCIDRIDVGLLPACVATCTGQAMHFGDLNDPGSLVSELAGTARTMRIEKGAKTSPRVIYVYAESAEATIKTCQSCHV
jgi:molybdopterin-containing oxidoreductase family iron-sulfur binding subunit